MGLRKFLKGFRASGNREDQNGSHLQIPNNSPPTYSSGSASELSTDTGGDNPIVQPESEDLWDRAYARLSLDTPKLVRQYEAAIVEYGPDGSPLASPGSYQREEQLRQLAKDKLDEIDLRTWQVKIGNQSMEVRDQFDKTVRTVIAVKDFISSAVSSEPHAALAWAGICVLLPLLVNPAEQRSVAHAGLGRIPFVVRRLRVMERLIRSGNSQLLAPGDHVDSVLLVRDFEETATELYRAILDYQMRFVRQHSEIWAKRYTKDVFKHNDWKTCMTQIETLEKKCTTIARDLSQEKVESALLESQRKMQSAFEEIQQDLQKVFRGIEQQTRTQSAWRQTDREGKCVQLFRQSNGYEAQKNRTPRRVPETGQWFLQNQKFVDWRETEGVDLLWLSAMPGSGKSVLARTLIDEGLLTPTTAQSESPSVVCYFFFKDISEYQRSATSAMCAILHQLFSAIPALVQHAIPPYELNGSELARLLDVMFGILVQAAADPAVGQVIVVLDALDECDYCDQPLIENIVNLYRDSKAPKNGVTPKLKFLLTSRPYLDLHWRLGSLLEDAPTIHLAADHESEKIKDEIDHVIDVQVQQLAQRKGYDEKSTAYLLEKLHNVENRTYLWFSLIMEEIRHSERPANQRELSRIISDLPLTIVGAFDAMLNRSRSPKLARQILQIILAASKPLVVEDLRVALVLADDLDCRSYEDIGEEDPEKFEIRIKNICGLLVTFDEGSVFLIHQTAKEYLLQTDDHTSGSLWQHSFGSYDSEHLLAQVCISLLSFSIFSKKPLRIECNAAKDTQEQITDYCNRHPLLEYAACNWAAHSEDHDIDLDENGFELIVSLCTTNTGLFQTWYTVYQSYNADTVPVDTTSLNLTTEFGFIKALDHFLQNGADPNERDGHGAVPLARAVKVSLSAVDHLLKAGALIDVSGWEYPWHDEVNDDGSEREVRPFSGTPLSMAIVAQDEDMVQYLVERGALINFPPNDFLTPLAAAVCCEASVDMYRLLLDSGADVSFGINSGEDPALVYSALHLAASMGNIDALRIFLDSPTSKINMQARLVRNEAREDQESSGRVEQETEDENDGERREDDGEEEGDDDNRSGSFMGIKDGSTALHAAAYQGHFECARILLDHGADVMIEDAHGHTPLEVATQREETAESGTLELLQEYSLRSNTL